MQKTINEIEKTWTDVVIGLHVADFFGVRQSIRKMICQLKELRVDVNIIADTSQPIIGIGKLSGRGNKDGKDNE